MGRWGIEFAQFSLQLFNDLVLGNQIYLDLILGDIYTHRTHYIGMVDDNNKVNFYDGLGQRRRSRRQAAGQVCARTSTRTGSPSASSPGPI